MEHYDPEIEENKLAVRTLQDLKNEINPQTFVFDGVEVRKTGRTAKRRLTSGKEDIQVEVTPVHTTSGSWKKWARENELYEVCGDQ